MGIPLGLYPNILLTELNKHEISELNCVSCITALLGLGSFLSSVIKSEEQKVLGSIPTSISEVSMIDNCQSSSNPNKRSNGGGGNILIHGHVQMMHIDLFNANSAVQDFNFQQNFHFLKKSFTANYTYTSAVNSLNFGSIWKICLLYQSFEV